MDLQQKLTEILKEEFVCDRCLGRQFAQLLSGLTNEERGKILRKYLAMLIDSGEKIKVNESNFHGIKFHNAKIKPKKPEKCSICGNIFQELKKKAKLIVKALNKYEFDTFLIGCIPTSELLEKEQKLWERVGIDWCETIRSEINRVLGKEVEALTGKVMERKTPDITVLYDLKKDEVTLTIRSIFIYGKYQKLVRNLPQTTWKTRIYPFAVQDYIAKPFMKQTKAEAHRLHGAGREDVDVRCLGWRPFVLELINPKKRKVMITKPRLKINKSKKVKVKDLKIASKKTVRRIKSIRPDKTYRAEVTFEKPVENLKKLKVLKGSVISQQTPTRVLTRRVDKIRRRGVKDIKYKLLNKKKIELRLTAQAGTYIKELIHGDEGRTQPSIADLINNKVKKIKLDVIKIHCD
ncbi:MAG: tRNA pseudouridine(54/55) synthase Pus10 [Candidatus Aenigmarchaeota archaeon]|nr:tRNA pseudouridine(54/55) synthase Pus10 [Candidatus Aenigmarchaeota archaeon]